MVNYFLQAVLKHTLRRVRRRSRKVHLVVFGGLGLGFLGVLTLVKYYEHNLHYTTKKLNITSIHSLIHTRFLPNYASALNSQTLRGQTILRNTTVELASDSEQLLNIYNKTKPFYNLWGPRELAYNLSVNRRPYDDRVLTQLLLLFDTSSDLMTRNSEKKKILVPRNLLDWWNPDKNDSLLGLERCAFGKKCELVFEGTAEADRYRKNISGAIIFANMYGLPIKKHTVYRQDFPDDVLVFFRSVESDCVTNVRLTKQNDILSNYWTGADIATPYAKWIYYDPSIRLNKIDKNYAAGKTKLAAIFVSNCKPSNTRSLYLQLLKKYIQVDVYGRCGGTHVCQKDNATCYQKLKKEYKFYLAFENANCRDYITEKFWHNALSHDVVPVVLGAHPDDYRASSPKNSYIHVEDFDGPRELAAYLQYLDKNDKEYNKYFEWKGTGKVVVESFFLCRVCLMLHYATVVPPPLRNQTMEFNSIESVRNHLCLPKDQPYWTRTRNLALESSIGDDRRVQFSPGRSSGYERIPGIQKLQGHANQSRPTIRTNGLSPNIGTLSRVEEE